MHHITSFEVAGATSIEVDGSLDVVAAYDLRCCDAAVAAGIVLTMTGCSRPLRANLATLEARTLRDRSRVHAPFAARLDRTG